MALRISYKRLNEEMKQLTWSEYWLKSSKHGNCLGRGGGLALLDHQLSALVTASFGSVAPPHHDRILQGDHKPGTLREFVKLLNSQGKLREI